MSLYFWINLLSISVPFLVSFHPRIKLYKKWRALFSAIVIVLIPYIIWDIYFTEHEYWGFNPTYLSGHYIFSLPIEEWLFFVCIPYACVFTHESILALNPKLGTSEKTTKIISGVLALLFIALIATQFKKAYTLVDSSFALIALALAYFTNRKLLSQFFITFLFMLIPFFIVNGVLTGSGIENEVVWYNDAENIGIRLFTIPLEDSAYAFSMLLFNLVLFKFFASNHS